MMAGERERAERADEFTEAWRAAMRDARRGRGNRGAVRYPHDEELYRHYDMSYVHHRQAMGTR